MPRRRALTPLLLVAIVGLASSACAPEPALPPSPKATGWATDEEAFAAAETSIERYIDALNAVDIADTTTLEELFTLSTSDLNEHDRQAFATYREDGYILEGDTLIRVLEPVSWSPDEGVAIFAACLDVAAVDLIGPDGVSVVAEDRPEIQPLTITARADESTGFLVANIVGRDGPPECS